MEESSQLKSEGNEYFKAEKFEEAIRCYLKALSLLSAGSSEAEVLHKNSAQCYLKLKKYSDAASAASKALDISPNDPKSLYRRCQAYEELGCLPEAFKDASHLLRVDPKNKAIQPILLRLQTQLKAHVQEKDSLTGRVTSMFELLEKDDTTLERKEQAINNLVALIKDSSGAPLIWQSPHFNLLYDYCRCPEPSLVLAAQRCLGLLAKPHKEKGVVVWDTLTKDYFNSYLQSNKADLVQSTVYFLQSLLYSVTQLLRYLEEREKHELARRKAYMKMPPFPVHKMDEEVDGRVTEMMDLLIRMINHRKVCALGRDSAMETLLKFVARLEGIGWHRKFIDHQGVSRVMEVAATVHSHAVLDLSENSRMTGALLLARVYDDLVSDNDRQYFVEICRNFIVDLLQDDLIETKVEAASALGALFQGPFEVASAVLGHEGLMEGMLLLVQSENFVYQKIALETVILMANKKDKCASIVQYAVPVLQEMYKTGIRDSIKIRALVGLCKLGSIGGTDASYRSLADGSNLQLGRACRRFLTTPTPSDEKDSKKWAVEGLAFLTLDAEIKEELINDKPALDVLLNYAKEAESEALFPLCTVLVNLTNTYDKVAVLPEMKDLAEYSKQHIPEEHPKDKEPCVQARVETLMKSGLLLGLHGLTARADKLDSMSSKELIARVYHGVASEVKYRGAIVQAGGGKTLISLALKNTEKGRVLSAQALAKISITMDPRVAFPGQRSLEVVRPVLQLLDMQRTALQNYEALLALTNLASVDDDHRRRISTEHGLSCIEQYMFEEHSELRQAATECVCNLAPLEELQERFLGENDRVKLLVLYCAEMEEPGLVRAASGALAVMSENPKIVEKITQVKSWFEIVQALAANEDAAIQHRGAHLLRNMIITKKELAEHLVGTDMLEVLMALTKLDMPERAPVRQCAEDALKALVDYQLIQPNETVA